MSMGLLLLVFGRAAWILKANSLVFSCMERLFDMLLDFPKAGWLGYGILVLLLLSMFVLNRLQHRWCMKKLTIRN